jgi:hypothetical protein
MKKYIVLIVFGLFLGLQACYYDKSDLLYPTSRTATCDTAGTVSYSQKIIPLLNSQCYSCHTATGGSGGINMSNYTNDKALAANGKLYGSIMHSTGFSPMPKGGSMFTVCQQTLIRKWIDAGTPNN